jgi:superfamily II DNA or RNA helicase
MEVIEFLDSRISEAIRPYQLEALDNINRYLDSDSNKQALIKMPMGTGKTVIISIASAFSPILTIV